MHFFYTRIAMIGSEISPRYKNLPDDQMAKIIDIWHRYASKFYEQQTVDSPFMVGLRYSKHYEHLIRQWKWPRWVDLYTEWPPVWLCKHAKIGEFATVTRLDADDSYSTDVFSFLNEFKHLRSRVLVLYKNIRQYNTENQKMTNRLIHESPMFASIVWNKFPRVDHVPINEQDREGPQEFVGLIGNHGNYHQQEHLSPQKCYALMRITGNNAQNRMGLMGRKRVDWKYVDPDPRFVGL